MFVWSGSGSAAIPDGPMSAAGRFDDDAGDGDAHRREDVDQAGETRLVGRCRVVVVVGVVSRTNLNRIVDALSVFETLIHSSSRERNGAWDGDRDAGSETTSRHAAE